MTGISERKSQWEGEAKEAERQLITDWLMKIYLDERALGCKPIVLQTILDIGVAIERVEYRKNEAGE